MEYALSDAGSSLLTRQVWILQELLRTSESWTQIFHSDVLGKGFSSMIGKVLEKKGCILLVQSRHPVAVFGAYSASAWYKSAQFYGDEDGHGCSVFSLSPAARYFSTTGFNQNFQYLGSGCTSGINPNGLGLGGQVKNFALFLDESLDFGHSYPSATFNNLQLHHGDSPTFEIETIEVWCPTKEALVEEGEAKKGILQNEKFKADKHILVSLLPSLFSFPQPRTEKLRRC